MPKAKIAALVATLTEQIAIAHGATIVDTPMKVGGKETTVRKAEGGLFDLDAARQILARRLEAQAEALTVKIG